jgi:hypothetical protein
MKQAKIATPTLTNAADFLLFVVEFAQTDLETLRAGDWLNLRENFATFLGRRDQRSILHPSGTAFLASPTHPPLPENFSPQDFAVLQAELTPFLAQLAAHSVHATSDPQYSISLFKNVEISLHPHGAFRNIPGVHQIVIHGSTDSCFWAILHWLIAQEPPGRILACPECKRLFYRVKQQAFCSRPCMNRVTVRQWRARQKQAEGDTAHR